MYSTNRCVKFIIYFILDDKSPQIHSTDFFIVLYFELKIALNNSLKNVTILSNHPSRLA